MRISNLKLEKELEDLVIGINDYLESKKELFERPDFLTDSDGDYFSEMLEYFMVYTGFFALNKQNDSSIQNFNSKLPRNALLIRPNEKSRTVLYHTKRFDFYQVKK